MKFNFLFPKIAMLYALKFFFSFCVSYIMAIRQVFFSVPKEQ